MVLEYVLLTKPKPWVMLEPIACTNPLYLKIDTKLSENKWIILNVVKYQISIDL